MAGECGREERPRDDVRRRAGSCPKVTSGDGQGAARDDVRRWARSCPGCRQEMGKELPGMTSGDGQGAARDDVRRWARSCPGCRQEMGRNHIPSGFRAKGRRTGFILR